jgi:hypothetical protein
MPIAALLKVKWIRNVPLRIFFFLLQMILLQATLQTTLQATLLQIPRRILPQSILQFFLLLRLSMFLPLPRLNL